MILVFLKSLVWIISITAIIHITVGYTLWSLLGLSYKKRLFICLISFAGIFLPDIIFPITLQNYLPSTPSFFGLSLSYFLTGFPFLFIPGLIFSSHFETSDFLSSLILTSPFLRFTRLFFPKFIRLMLPFSIILFLTMFHIFSLPALWEIELLPNYLFAEFNTFYSFAPFFKKILIISPLLLIISLTYYKYFSPSKSEHFTIEKFDKSNFSFIPGISIFSIWFFATIIFPSIYWGIFLFGQWHNVDWSKVVDCWTFSLQVGLYVSAISLIAGVATIYFRKTKLILFVIILYVIFSLGNIAVAVSGIFLFSNIDFLSNFNETIVPMLFSLCVMYVPVAMTLLLFLKKQINQNIYQSAQLYISKKSKRLRYISIPILLPGIIVVTLIILNFVGKDLDTSILMVPPGKSFLPVRLHLLLHYADFPSLAAVVLIYIFGIIITISLIYTFVKKIIRYEIF